MKRFSEQLHNKAKTVKLRAAERHELRERVVSYMEYHPLPKVEAKQTKPAPIMTESFKVVTIPYQMLLRAGAAFALVLLIAVPILAERSVPGDGLYAVKVRFNEEVRSSLALNQYQKIEWETQRLNRRIAEARLLASEGRLTDEVEEQVAEAVREHSENAQKGIEALREEDEEEAALASIAFETTLEVQASSLAEKQANDSATSSEEARGDILATVINETRAKQGAQNASSTIPGFDKLMARVELNTTRAYELLATLQTKTETQKLQDVSRRLEDIERSILEALNLREEDEEAARGLLVEVLQRTQKLIVLMTDIEVAETVDIETIVPVVLTPEEQTAERTRIEAEVTQGLVELERLLEQIEDEDLAEKVQFAIEEIVEKQTILTETADFKAYVSISEEIFELTADTKLFIDASGEEIAPVAEDEVTEEENDETEPDTATSTPEAEAELESETESATTTPVQVREVDPLEPEFPREDLLINVIEISPEEIDTTE